MSSKKMVKLNYHQWRWLKSMQQYGCNTLPTLIAKHLVLQDLIKPDVTGKYHLTEFGEKVLETAGEFKVYYSPPHPAYGRWKWKNKATIYV